MVAKIAEAFEDRHSHNIQFTSFTVSGSIYIIELFADSEPHEHRHSGARQRNELFYRRRGAATVNGVRRVGHVGFSRSSRSYLILPLNLSSSSYWHSGRIEFCN